VHETRSYITVTQYVAVLIKHVVLRISFASQFLVNYCRLNLKTKIYRTIILPVDCMDVKLGR